MAHRHGGPRYLAPSYKLRCDANQSLESTESPRNERHKSTRKAFHRRIAGTIRYCERKNGLLEQLLPNARTTPVEQLRHANPNLLAMKATVTEGDLLEQTVDIIVNAWNRNIIPWWLLLPQGVSGAIKKRGGTGPFRELRKHGAMPLGSAVLTSAGHLPFKAIIHVAGINMFWRASERSIRDSVRNAMAIAEENGFQSIAFPLIGAGSGGFNQEQAKEIMLDAFQKLESPLAVTVVVFSR